MNDEQYDYRIRSYLPELVKYYEIKLTDYKPITLKTYKLVSEDGSNFFLKQTNDFVMSKYLFLESKRVNNILYPILNSEKRFVTATNNFSFYVNDYITETKIRDDLRAASLFDELISLHHQTIVQKRLDPIKSRPKFDELTSQLDYKFRMLESLVRKVESKPLNLYSMPILENYHYILDAKRELIKLQKRIISSVKAKESVEYSFIHNNPKLDHLLNVRGVNYLTSLDRAKMGVSSLDIAKFYVQNEHLEIDFKNLILSEYFDENHLFYYDYFRYLVLVIYIKRLVISTEDYVNANMIISVSNSIKKYFQNFSDYKEQTSEPQSSSNY